MYATTTTAIANNMHIVPIIIYFILAFPLLFNFAILGCPAGDTGPVILAKLGSETIANFSYIVI